MRASRIFGHIEKTKKKQKKKNKKKKTKKHEIVADDILNTF